MTQKQFDALASPVKKLESVAETNAARLSSIELLTVTGNNMAAMSLVESKKQTSLLTDIKQHINELVITKRQEMKEQSSGGGFKFTGIEGVKIALFMVAASVGIAGASQVLAFTADVSPKQLVTAGMIALAFIPMSDAFVKIYKAIKPASTNTSVFLSMANTNMEAITKGRLKKTADPKELDAKTALGFTISAMIAMSIGIMLTSYALKLMAMPSFGQIITAGLIAFALIPMAQNLVIILKHLKKENITADKKGLKELGMGIATILLVATGFVAVGLVMKLYPESTVIPDINFAIVTGIVLWIYSKAFNNVISATSGKKIKDLTMASGIFVLLAMAAVSVAYAFALYPGDPSNMPGIKFTLLSGVSLFIYANVFSKIIKAIGRKSVKAIVTASSVFVLLATSIVGVAYAFALYPGDPSNMPGIKFTILSGVSLFIFANVFSKIIKAIGRKSVKAIVTASAVFVLLAVSIVGVAYAFALYPGDPSNLPSAKFSLLAGLSLLSFSFAFTLLARNMKRVSYGDLAKAAVASVFVALAIVGTAFIFSYLSSVGAFIAPPYDWSMKAGMALLVFGLGYAGVAILTKTLGISTMIQGIIGVALMALAILAVGWIFSALDGVGFTAPPISWSIAVALSLVAFTIPALVIGLIATSGIGAVGLVLGIVGMIVIAAGIWVVAWIFSTLPDLTSVSKMLTEALLTPVNGIVDVLKRLKEEIGVENLLPLAGGIIAIAGSLLVLAAASAGAAAAGLGASLMNAGKAFVDWISGEDTKGPLDILTEIVSMGPKIIKLAKPIEAVGQALSFIKGGSNMEVMTNFIKALETKPNEGLINAIKEIADPITKMIDALNNLDVTVSDQLNSLFGSVPWTSIYEPVKSVSNSMSILASSASLAGSGVMLVANGMNIMVDALNRLTRESIERVIELFTQVQWNSLVDPISAISTSMNLMSHGAMQTGEGMKLVSQALSLMSNISVEILRQISNVFDSITKSTLTSQGDAMLYGIAPAMASISATMLVMRSDAYIKMFEVMASSSEAIVAMSRPMSQIASSMDKMGGISVNGIEWVHKMVGQLAKSSFDSQATALEKISKSYSNISKSSNTMNVEAINATTDMFKALAYLYQNGRKNAMEELGEKLTEAVRELAKMISNFEGTVNDQAKGNKTISSEMANAIEGLSNKLGLTANKIVPQSSSNEGVSNFGPSTQQVTSNEDVVMVMQELLDLLQSGQAKITITDLDPAAEAKLA